MQSVVAAARWAFILGLPFGIVRSENAQWWPPEDALAPLVADASEVTLARINRVFGARRFECRIAGYDHVSELALDAEALFSPLTTEQLLTLLDEVPTPIVRVYLAWAIAANHPTAVADLEPLLRDRREMPTLCGCSKGRESVATMVWVLLRDLQRTMPLDAGATVRAMLRRNEVLP